MIAGSAYARLDLSRKVVKSGAACELGMTPDALEDFLKFLSDHEECGLIHYEDGIITTDRTQENYERVEADRLRKRGMGVSSMEKRKNGAEESYIGAEESNKLKETKLKGNNIYREGCDMSEDDQDKGTSSRFKAPTIDEVKAYCSERKNNVAPERFLDYYESKGWLVGKSKMKNWKAAIRTWEHNETTSKEPVYKTVEVTPEMRAIIDRSRAEAREQ
jgi:hypothetical protein